MGLINAVSATAVILAAIIGAYIDRWLRRRKIRGAVLAEIESMEWINETDLTSLKKDIKSGESLAHTYVPTDVYDNELSNIGLLSRKEIRGLTEYYQAAHVAQQQLNQIQTGEDTEETRAVLADRTLHRLKTRRKSAAETLESKLTLRARIGTALHKLTRR